MCTYNTISSHTDHCEIRRKSIDFCKSVSQKVKKKVCMHRNPVIGALKVFTVLQRNASVIKNIENTSEKTFLRLYSVRNLCIFVEDFILN